MEKDRQTRIRDFIYVVGGLYISEYARRKISETSEHVFEKSRYGHSSNIYSALAKRKKCITAIQRAAEGLTQEDLLEAKQVGIAEFHYSRKLNRGNETITIRDYYDRAEVAELFDEAVCIALGDLDNIKSVSVRFGITMPRPPSPAFGGRLARYKAWLES